MTISDLLNVVSAPENPVEKGRIEDLSAIEAKLGAKLPEDAVQFGLRLGSGRFGDSVRVYNPFAPRYVQMVKFVAKIYHDLKVDEGDEYLPFDLFPVTPGLLPWGDEVNGAAFFWLTEGHPDQWPIVLIEHGGRFERLELSMTGFLARVFSGRIDCISFDREYLKSLLGIQFRPEQAFF